MNLFEKIKTLYPEFTNEDHRTFYEIQDDMDGEGEYIVSWSHPTIPQPTEEQLQGVA